MEGAHTILFDARTATRAFPGINRYIRSLLAALVPKLHADEHLHVILSPETTIPCLDNPHVTIHTTGSPANTLKSHWQAFKLARAIKAQIYHAPFILTPIRVPGKMVLTVHDVIPLSHPQYSTFFTRLFWKFTGIRAIHHSRRIIGVSEDALKACARLFGTQANRRSVVIYHGIDPAFQPQSPEAIAEIRQTYHLPEKFLLYLGSDRPHKNLTTLLHALALLDPMASIPLVIAGVDSESSPLRKAAEQLGLDDARVQWIGEVPDQDLPALYSAAHAFLFPSLVEGFGFPVLEAMACGTPVICSALNVLKEITAGAVTIVHPTDRQEWLRAIQTAIVSLEWHDLYRDKGLARAARFSWQTAAQTTLDVYRQLYPKQHARSTEPPAKS
jgi:alpha-1,3-rhamnosyl/mannosyltransferase